MNIGRIYKLIEHLKTVPPERWAFNRVITPCGTAGCAVGQFPHLWPEDWQIVRIDDKFVIEYPDFRSVSAVHAAAKYLDIHYCAAYRLFFTSFEVYHKANMRDVTALEVADALSRFVANEPMSTRYYD